jgi:hypothetical protein
LPCSTDTRPKATVEVGPHSTGPPRGSPKCPSATGADLGRSGAIRVVRGAVAGISTKLRHGKVLAHPGLVEFRPGGPGGLRFPRAAPFSVQVTDVSPLYTSPALGQRNGYLGGKVVAKVMMNFPARPCLTSLVAVMLGAVAGILLVVSFWPDVGHRGPLTRGQSLMLSASGVLILSTILVARRLNKRVEWAELLPPYGWLQFSAVPLCSAVLLCVALVYLGLAVTAGVRAGLYPTPTGAYCSMLFTAPPERHAHQLVCHKVGNLDGDAGRDTSRVLLFTALAVFVGNAVRRSDKPGS